MFNSSSLLSKHCKAVKLQNKNVIIYVGWELTVTLWFCLLQWLSLLDNTVSAQKRRGVVSLRVCVLRLYIRCHSVRVCVPRLYIRCHSFFWFVIFIPSGVRKITNQFIPARPFTWSPWSEIYLKNEILAEQEISCIVGYILSVVAKWPTFKSH